MAGNSDHVMMKGIDQRILDQEAQRARRRRTGNNLVQMLTLLRNRGLDERAAKELTALLQAHEKSYPLLAI